jgi:diacylglycerol kinase family enzyme
MRVLFVNPRSGSADALADVRREAERRGIEIRDLAELDASGADILGVAGGDGSLASVAALALERDLPFVVVPLGTRNHFARDLGIDPDDPVAALDAFDAPERRVDVGRVNGRLFLNNVSLGAYAAAVHQEGRGSLRAVARWVLRFRRSPLRVGLDGEERKVLVLLVGNNEYDGRGSRDRLDGGALSAYSLEHGRLLGLRREIATRTSLVVHARVPRVRAAIDGEPAELEAPLRFELEPRALRVRIAG